jgi:hypothetical protein
MFAVEDTKRKIKRPRTLQEMRERKSLPKSLWQPRWLCHALAWSCLFALAERGAGDQEAEQRLNEVYTRLRHTLTPAEKETLKQEELDWLKQRGRFSNGDPQWIELTEQRISELQARLSGASEAPALQEPKSDAASPDGRYIVAESKPAPNGGPEIELRTTEGETLTTLYPGAQIGFKAHWSEDSEHLIVIAINRYKGRQDDMLAMAEKVYGKWESIGYSLPPAQGSGITFLKWLSPATAQFQWGNRVITMPFPKPTKFVFPLDRFSALTLETEPGNEKVTYETGDKRESQTVFDSPVKLAGGMSYVSPRGTRFQLEKLERPVINDSNRRINSGDWRVIVSGSGDEYLSLKEKIGEPSFGDTGKTEYYGSIVLMAEGK